MNFQVDTSAAIQKLVNKLKLCFSTKETPTIPKVPHHTFHLGDTRVKDVMVPRVHVIFADIDYTYNELIAIFRDCKYTRLPVYEETTDNIIGTINMKDLLLFDGTEDFNMRNILRPAFFTHEQKRIADLMAEMREDSLNIAIVVDEYGETAGIITLEDILEEIVGEIRDEYDDHEEEFIIQITPYEFIVKGAMNLDDLYDRISLHLESEDYDSLGGYIIERLERFPKQNDEVILDNKIRLVVDSLVKNRIEKVHIYLPKDFYEQAEE